ncbi:hypothetical protein [Paraburkholderia tropica]|uniref:hypothetical protein n=1 Tax=Paraburkholderia tropica TaxID=92647 RepID=UPI003D291A53
MPLNRCLVIVLTLLAALACSLDARADDTQAGGQQTVPTDNGTTISVPSKGDDTVGATVKAGEIASGANKAAEKFSSLFNAVIPAAVEASQSIRSESDKFAGGLALITLVLAFVRYAATRDPVTAWLAVFEELGMLGIFASIYVGYQSFGPGFFNWFQSLANMIQAGAGQGVSASIGAAAGRLLS